MNILVTNDDGIFAPGLWALVGELAKIGRVIVVAPDREQSAVGTAITLRMPLRMRKMELIPLDVETYAVEGTPGDCVVLALGNLIKDKIDLVVSGINHGPNLGDDVLISGTVGGALQGYLRGLPAIACSLAMDWGKTEGLHLETAARVVACLARRVIATGLAENSFLNVNTPDVPAADVKGLRVTRLAHETHIETVEEGFDGKRAYYWLMRHSLNQNGNLGERTDIKAIEDKFISVTPLHLFLSDRPAMPISETLCADVLEDIKSEV